MVNETIHHTGQPGSANIPLIQQLGLPRWLIKGSSCSGWHNQLIFLSRSFLHDARSPRGAARWEGPRGLPGLHTSPPAPPAPPALTCPPSTPSAVNYPDPAVIDHSAGSCHEGPQLKNDKCSPLGLLQLSVCPRGHRSRVLIPKNQWPQLCLCKFSIIDHWFDDFSSSQHQQTCCVGGEARDQSKRAGDFRLSNRVFFRKWKKGRSHSQD